MNPASRSITVVLAEDQGILRSSLTVMLGIEPDPDLAAESWSADAGPLTDREREILRRAGEGESTADLAQSLRLTEGTIRNYLSEAISKLGAHNRTEAARLAHSKGWL